MIVPFHVNEKVLLVDCRGEEEVAKRHSERDMGLRGLSEGKVYGDWTGDYGGKDDFDEKEYDGDSNNEDDKGEHHKDEGKYSC